MDQAFINRSLNQGFSGGEKKRMEIVQMLMLKPSFRRPGRDGLGAGHRRSKIVAEGVNRLRGTAFGA